LVTEADIDLARKVAYRIGSKWSAVEIEDLTSELILWLYEHPGKVGEYRRNGDEGKLGVALRRVAASYSVRQQEHRAGGLITQDAPYTFAQIERALPFMWESTPETLVLEVGNRPAQSIPSEFGLAQAILIDLRDAFSQLPDVLKTTLTLRFRDGETFHTIASLMDVSEMGAFKRVARAIETMRDYLSGESYVGR
jgi:RNA polymerase sigma factor (sigma-70 family)